MVHSAQRAKTLTVRQNKLLSRNNYKEVIARQNNHN
jgi:hypothetical protein